jgi:acetylornithine deacetylase/succinyl-diaminopimelate desuccinylase-like protein
LRGLTAAVRGQHGSASHSLPALPVYHVRGPAAGIVLSYFGRRQEMNQVVDFINTSRDRYLEELKAYLAIPSISALPEHTEDMKRCAEWTAEEMRRIGMDNVRTIETGGHPVVYGEWLGAPGAPTMLFYGHYDVQPVDPVELWETPPFEASIRDGEIYARGAADDKGQIFMHFKAVEAHMRQNGRLPLNVKFLLEGEEEVGSRHLDDLIREHKEQLRADVLVISDSPMFDRGVPSICYGLRGLAYCQIDLRGTSSDLHSGSFGGAVANPAFVLAQVLAQMKDRSGRVKIPGFYDEVRPLKEEERNEFKRLPFDEKRYRKNLGAPRLFGEKGYSTLERVWARPTFEVNGLLSGFTGEGAKTVIPAVAMAKVSMRLVPDQDPDKIASLFEAYVKKVTPPTVELKVTKMHGGRPWMTDFDNPFVQAAARAIERGFGKRPVFNREGGSIPVVATFQQELQLPTVLFGIGLPDENAHAPNEKLDLENFHNGVIAAAYFYDEIAGVSAGA